VLAGGGSRPHRRCRGATVEAVPGRGAVVPASAHTNLRRHGCFMAMAELEAELLPTPASPPWGRHQTWRRDCSMAELEAELLPTPARIV
jgi:hypothetical protein